MKQLLKIQTYLATLAICLLLGLSSQQVAAQVVCDAGFSWTYDASTLTVHFVSNTHGDSLNVDVNYTWDFPADLISSGQDQAYPSIQLPSIPEIYTFDVCQTVDSAADDCEDQFCETITVDTTGNGNWNPTDSLDCSALFDMDVVVVDNEPFATVSFTALDLNDVTTYLYELNGIGVYQDPSGSIIVDEPGEYLMCLTVHNFANDCTDTSCHDFVFGETSDCEAWMDWTWDDTGYIYTFYAGAWDNPEIATVTWSINNLPTDLEGEVVTIDFQQDGEYVVCNTVTTVDGCVSTDCATVTIEGNGSNGWIPSDSAQWINPTDTLIIWPGDANNDGIANNEDLLYIGMGYDVNGSSRWVQSIDWEEQYGMEWAFQFLDGTNMAYADCDGNGVINEQDLIAVNANYGQTHNKTGDESEASSDDPSFYVELPEAAMDNGDQLVAPLVLGDESLPVNFIYGVAFTIEYNPLLIDPTSVQLTFVDSWMGPVSELLTISKSFPQDGIIEAAISAKGHADLSGYGAVASLTGIIDNIAGKVETDFNIQITNVKAITNDDSPVLLNTEVQSTGTINEATSLEILGSEFTSYPNPANNQLFLDQVPANSLVQIRDVQGRIYIEELLSERSAVVGLENLSAGVYLLTVQSGEFKHTSKLQIIK